MNDIRIVIFGLWHQGIVAAACLSELGYSVIGVASDENDVNALNKGTAPIYEPGLDDLLRKGIQNGRLTFLSDDPQFLKESDYVFLMHDTPVNDEDQSDLSTVFRSTRELAPFLNPKATVLVTAQVPVGTCEIITRSIAELNPKWERSIAYMPENLRLGNAINCFKNLTLPVIGADSDATFDKLLRVLRPLGTSWSHVSLRTSEVLKHALNSFLALNVSYGNEIGRICEAIGADGKKVAQLLKLEPRVSPKAMLTPGLAFSGGTLARDIQTLKRLSLDYQVPMELIHAVWDSNNSQKNILISKLLKYFDVLSKKKFAILGLTYKPGTSTLRRSLSIELYQALLDCGATVSTADPKVDQREAFEIFGSSYKSDVNEVFNNVDGGIIMTQCFEFKELDLLKIAARMKGKYILDAAGLWRAAEVTRANLIYDEIGIGATIDY